jgi:hypothetical protein
MGGKMLHTDVACDERDDTAWASRSRGERVERRARRNSS